MASTLLSSPYYAPNIYSFNKHLSISTLLGDGDADENKSNYLKEAYLPHEFVNYREEERNRLNK